MVLVAPWITGTCAAVRGGCPMADVFDMLVAAVLIIRAIDACLLCDASLVRFFGCQRMLS